MTLADALADGQILRAQMDVWMVGWTDGRMHGWMDGRMHGQTDGRTDGWMAILESQLRQELRKPRKLGQR